ncbi:prepilin-type N-terminal cleavage/methylation domain-containing protein [Desulfoscipio sp. XC116]|uniref:PilW family protein n=1 Tax=Desulfoscipio sp. XC116 TaxID=3144975 RepID=UPI00325A8223
MPSLAFFPRRYPVIQELFHKNIRGLTLIELMLASAILLIVLAVLYPFYSYATRSIDIAAKQREVQQNVLLSKEIIESIRCKIRSSSYLIILKNTPASPGEEGCEGFVDTRELYVTESGVLMHSKKDGTQENLLGSYAEDTHFTLTFEKSGPKLLKYTIHGEYNGQEYEISSEIAILNIGAIKEEEVGTPGVAIRYAFSE